MRTVVINGYGIKYEDNDAFIENGTVLLGYANTDVPVDIVFNIDGASISKEEINAEHIKYVSWCKNDLYNVTLVGFKYIHDQYIPHMKLEDISLHLDISDDNVVRAIKIDNAVEKKDVSFIDKMQEELEELTIKHDKLEAFIGTDTFKEMASKEQQTLLQLQLSAMNQYKLILTRRIAASLEEMSKC